MPFAKPPLQQVKPFVWEIPTSFKPGMRVPARIYGSKELIDAMDFQVYDQITNVATLPGLVKNAFCMPDGHSGYGFPIGGVAAFDPADKGVISPGGIGFDINCGMRMVLTNLTLNDVQPKLKELINSLYDKVPAGVGATGLVKITKDTFKKVTKDGAHWCVENGYGWPEDLERTELMGRAEGADPSKCSDRAITRGHDQIGTLGSGNHYLEIQHVSPENILDEQVAKAWGIFPDQIVIMFHCGSRGFGHQIGTDYLRLFLSVMERKYGIKVLDRELASAPFSSPEGRDYYAAMQCAVNMSFANRQTILHRIREVFGSVFKTDAEKLGMHMLYDVSHNRGSLEKHLVDGSWKELIVHRKGATSSFGAGHNEVPPFYRSSGQPVIIGGSMESGSYLLIGKDTAAETWFSTCHGAGRAMSRTEAKRRFRGEELIKDMEQRGIYVRTVSYSGAAEEAGAAYKNIDAVVDVVHQAGLSNKVAKLIPIGNVKG